MVLTTLILVVSGGLFLFYVQAICQGILRREFEQRYFEAIVNANRLEFLSVLRALEHSDMRVNYSRLRVALHSDFLMLTYLLKHASNTRLSYAPEERLLIFYFRLVFFALGLRHQLKLRERPAVLKLAAILQYFANVIGQRASEVRVQNTAALVGG